MSEHQEFYDRLVRTFEKTFPTTYSLVEKNELSVDWKHLASPFEVSLNAQTQKNIALAIKELFKESRNFKLGAQIEKSSEIKNHSVLMSYDFHTSPDGAAKLIEVNTNASGFLISALNLACHDQLDLRSLPAITSLKNSFESEIKAHYQTLPSKVSIAIVDDNIQSQKMRLEFYLYKELFESWGWSAEIFEAKDLAIQNGRAFTPSGVEVHLVYSRSTDFYLTEDSHKNLRQIFYQGLAVVSPQPIEYDLLADKNRLLELQNTSDSLHAAVQNILLESRSIKDFSSSEDLWTKRKKYFFKPKNSFGGKSAYRGQSLSHKVFDRIISSDPMIQEYMPPEKMNGWKFDLRCFAYKDEIQMISARLYKGQLTNFSSLFGGFCPVRLKS